MGLPANACNLLPEVAFFRVAMGTKSTRFKRKVCKRALEVRDPGTHAQLEALVHIYEKVVNCLKNGRSEANKRPLEGHIFHAASTQFPGGLLISSTDSRSSNPTTSCLFFLDRFIAGKGSANLWSTLNKLIILLKYLHKGESRWHNSSPKWLQKGQV